MSGTTQVEIGRSSMTRGTAFTAPARAALGARRRSAAKALLAALLLGASSIAAATHAAGHDATEPGAATSGSGPSALETLRQLGASAFGGAPQEEFLHPDAAFVLSAQAMDDGAVLARWDIADAYYLYRDRFRFALKDSPGATLGAPQLPAGKVKDDPYFGRLQVYYGAAEARLPVTWPREAPREVNLEITYQGCADAGLCYPPITKTVSLSPPSAFERAPGGAAPAANALPAGELPEQDRLARALATGDTWLVLLAFFGLGLLLTFTPCVLPMIPILSSIIVGQGPQITTRRAFALSLTYVLAMSATYTAAGIIAGLSGANLQAAFQSPWVLGSFAAVFVLLALAMFGAYDLQMPVALQQRLVALSSRQRGGTYLGVGVMGLLSALIVGPCVAAPLAGALIYIARTGDAVLGGAALLALSLGMGVPVLVIGTTAGRLMPRAGPWMKAVKMGFGVILLGVAVYLLERLVPGWASLLLWAALLVVVAAFLGVFRRRGAPRAAPRWLARGAGLAALAYAAVLLAGAATGGDDPLRPLSRLVAAQSGDHDPPVFRSVKGLAGLEAELARAGAEDRPVMLDFYADWCVSCKELERYTFSDRSVKAVLARAVLLRADVTANDAEDQALLEAYGLFGPPAILFFGADGVERSQYRVVGFMAADAFRELARRGLLEAPGKGDRLRATKPRTPRKDA